jgi:TorA maturation chaperone TorD
MSFAAAHDLAPEDQARADFYALRARVYAGGPDAALLRSIAAAPALAAPAFTDRAQTQSAQLCASWARLRSASEHTDPAAATQEYVDLFVGVGRSEVNLHASHWLSGYMMERPLADLRRSLAVLRLQRKAETNMLEDHLSALCETMRLLVAGHSARMPATVGEQREFFRAQIDPWIERCTQAIRAHAIANYYAAVAQFTQAFMALEHESLDIE